MGLGLAHFVGLEKLHKRARRLEGGGGGGTFFLSYKILNQYSIPKNEIKDGSFHMTWSLLFSYHVATRYFDKYFMCNRNDPNI